jgi:hypothetical protein
MVAKTIARALKWMSVGLGLLLAGPLLVLAFGAANVNADWRSATHRSTGQAPDPATNLEATVQVYAGRAFSWRGAFSVHTWLAAKPAGATGYTRYEVIGWNLRSSHSAVSVSDFRAPDGEWFGAAPQLIRDLRGAAAEAVIARLPQAVASYPYAGIYRAWPGPNSNTFIAHLGRAIPELHLAMPSNAVGKDYPTGDGWFARAPSGTGYQMSMGGVLGVLAAQDEGFELNVLGLVTGVDLRHPALKLPGIGSVPGGDRG